LKGCLQMKKKSMHCTKRSFFLYNMEDSFIECSPGRNQLKAIGHKLKST
jgi:hypothetical protein